MIYKIGTTSEIPSLASALPKSVLDKLYFCTVTLDDAYGAARNYYRTGGYSIIAETAEDLVAVRSIIDFYDHSCEWADRISSIPEYLSALYLLNDDYSIVLFMPISIAPPVLLEELTDENEEETLC